MIEYTHHSPSSLNTFAAEPALWGLERLLKVQQVMGAPAHRGTAVEAGVAYGLLHPDTAPKRCHDEALRSYDGLMALSSDARKEKYRDSIPGMVDQALLELLPYGIPTKVQGFVEWKPSELKYPLIGFYDFFWEEHNLIVDLKTTATMPSEIKVGHARQVSLYCCNSNAKGVLVYVTPKKCTSYVLENTREHCDALVEIAKTVETLLELSNGDPEFFKKLYKPNLDAFYWSEPRMRQLAWEHFKI